MAEELGLGSGVLGEGDLDSEVGSLISRFEVVRNDIMSELANISTANGYRNNVADVISAIRPLDRITAFPEIGIEMGERTIESESSNWQTSEAVCDVYIQGAVSSNTNVDKAPSEIIDAIESIGHDILRVMASIFVKYINPINFGNSGRWSVENSPVKVSPPMYFGDKLNKGFIIIQFQVRLVALDSTFA